MYSFASDAFLLGISTGVYCFSQCGLVFIPYIFSEDNTGIKNHWLIVCRFLLGRFSAYAATGFLVGYLGERAGTSSFSGAAWTVPLIGISYIIISVLLIFNAFNNRAGKDGCLFGKIKNISYLPVLLGIFTGINICPPFIAAVAKSFATGSMIMGGVFFMLFFAATSIFILPLIFSGLLKRIKEIRIIAGFVSALAGGFLAVQGIFYLMRIH